MIPAGQREPVIRNIRDFAEAGEFHKKVELHDPVLTAEESRAITARYMARRGRPGFRFKRGIAVGLANFLTAALHRETVIEGMEKIPADLQGVIITSNHFSPLENTAIRHLVKKAGLGRLHIVSQVSNFAMPGIIGFLMNYADTVPISENTRYLARDFMAVLREILLKKREPVLLYPEQEMWFRYRKPRPPKNGAYYYGAKLGVPVLSCYVEMVDTEEDDAPNFKKVKYVVHVLGVLRPDPEKNAKQNAAEMASRDYALKKACYERLYGKPLDYRFEKADIAGWRGDLS